GAGGGQGSVGLNGLVRRGVGGHARGTRHGGVVPGIVLAVAVDGPAGAVVNGGHELPVVLLAERGDGAADVVGAAGAVVVLARGAVEGRRAGEPGLAAGVAVALGDDGLRALRGVAVVGDGRIDPA